MLFFFLGDLVNSMTQYILNESLNYLASEPQVSTGESERNVLSKLANAILNPDVHLEAQVTEIEQGI